jgi:hypothetical protein
MNSSKYCILGLFICTSNSSKGSQRQSPVIHILTKSFIQNLGILIATQSKFYGFCTSGVQRWKLLATKINSLMSEENVLCISRLSFSMNISSQVVSSNMCIQSTSTTLIFQANFILQVLQTACLIASASLARDKKNATFKNNCTIFQSYPHQIIGIFVFLYIRIHKQLSSYND